LYSDAPRPASVGATTDRRRVTVLFADLVGFTALAERLDPEDLREIQAAYFAAITPPITAFGGSIEKYIGDAILAVFGAPQAHEDDAERAVHAAFALHAALETLNARLDRERSLRLAIRIGIQTGLVVATVEPGGGFIVTGDTVNLAARLQDAAEPGAVLIGAETQRLIAHAYATIPLGEIPVRGRASPVPAYRVLPHEPWRPTRPVLAATKSPLVGRQSELKALMGVFGRLTEGCGGIVTITGEAGLGKSRLVTEARRNAHIERSTTHTLQPVQWLEGRCLSYGNAVAYQIWRDLIRSAARIPADTAAESASQALRAWLERLCPDRGAALYPFLARLLALPLAPEAADGWATLLPQQRQRQTFDAVATAIACLARQAPLAVICEDLHWADLSSVALLEHLLPLTADLPLLFVCISRPLPDHGDWRLGELAARCCGQRTTDISLQPLSPEEGDDLIRSLLAAWLPETESRGAARKPAISAGLRLLVLRQAEGNPFFVEEVMRALINRGALRHDLATHTWDATREAVAVTAPTSIISVLAARIDHLPAPAQRILRLAAVIGRIFAYRLLAALNEEAADLDASLRDLQQQELIRPRAEAVEREFIFKHELTRQAAYEGLLKAERRAAHRRVAEALERLLGARADEQLGLLADHWERAEAPEQAVAYLLAAGDQARLAYALQEAIDFYQRALAWQRASGDDEAAARTLMRLGLTHNAAFDYRRAEAVANEGFALWQAAMARPPAAAHLPGENAPQTLRLSWYPWLTPEALRSRSAPVQLQLFSGLVEETPALEVIPAVAEGWDVSPDGRVYTFHLRRNACWSDGAAVSAADFLAGWRRTLDPAMPDETALLLDDIRGGRAYHRGALTNCDDLGIRPVGPHTLVVELDRPAAYFLHILALPVATPAPSHLIETGAPAERWVSNGPFVVEAIRPGEALVLARNPAYTGRFTGNVARVEVDQRFAAGDWEGMIEAIRTGRYDVCNTYNFPPAAHAAIRSWHTGEVLNLPSLVVGAWVFNVTQPPFDDIRVRRAFQRGVDVRRVIWEFNEGRISPATGGWIPPGIPGHSPGLAPPFDLAEARRLLAEAGYSADRPFPVIRIMGADSPGADGYARLYLAQMRDNLGVTVDRWKPGPVERERVLRTATVPPANMIWLGDGMRYPDPDDLLRVIGHQLWRMVGRRDAEFDRLVEEARHLQDHAARLALYRQADAILVREAYVWPHLYARTHLVLQPWVKRYPVSPLPMSFWKDVILAPRGVTG